MLIVYAHCVILLAKIKTVILIEEYVPLTAIYAYTVSPCSELVVIIGIKEKMLPINWEYTHCCN